MKKSYSPPASSHRMGETEQTIPSSTAQSVAAYVRTGMAMIYENDKATGNDSVDRALLSLSPDHTDVSGRA